MSNEINEIKKEELLDFIQKMYDERRRLVIINGYINKEGENVIAYNFDVNGKLKTYVMKCGDKIPSITPIYEGAAQWCEEEICEMYGIEFEGLEKSDRLFLPDEFDGRGQIFVLPLEELKKKNNID